MRAKIVIVSLLLSLSACSSMSGESKTAGLLAGGGIGTAIGAAIGNSAGYLGEGAAIGAGVGAGLGLLTGSYMAQGASEQSEQAAAYVVRVPLEVSDNQDQIDTLRRDMEDKSMFGGGESKPWNERYLGENPSLPYQGPPTGIPF